MSIPDRAEIAVRAPRPPAAAVKPDASPSAGAAESPCAQPRTVRLARRDALRTLATGAGAIAASVLLGGCGGGGRGGAGGRGDRTVAVGSKNFTEELLLGEMYAQLLEHHGMHVDRKLNLGGTQIAMAALQRGEIDLYPEYTGTALLVELKARPLHDARAIYETVKRAYAQRWNLVWLDPAPMNDTQALATTQAVSARYRIRTLSELSRTAPQLRLGAVPEFVQRPDGLPGLQRAYGGFHFKSVKLFDIGLKYKALLSGAVDVVVAFGTDGQIEADRLVVLVDDRHFWPAYQVAPVVRRATLDRHPELAAPLNRLAPELTDAVMRHLNYEIDGRKREPADVARDFLKAKGLTA